MQITLTAEEAAIVRRALDTEKNIELKRLDNQAEECRTAKRAAGVRVYTELSQITWAKFEALRRKFSA